MIDEFDNFLLNSEHVLFEIIPKKFLFVLTKDNFIARAANWWRNDMTTTEVIKISSLTTYYGFSQIIFDATYILPNSSSCIEFINNVNIWS